MKNFEVPFHTFEFIPDILIHTAQIHPELISSRIRRGDDFQSYTYKDFLEGTQKIARFLIEKGLKPGDRVGVLGENRPEWGMCFFGIQYAGGVVVPLDARATPSEWAHLLRHSESSFIFVSGNFYPDVEEFIESVPNLSIISMDGNQPEPNLPRIFKAHQPKMPPVRRTRENLSIILYTSGTTGTSKGVMLTHGNLLSNIEASVNIFYFDETDRFFSVLPIHHVFECMAGFLCPITVGASVTYSRSLKSKELLEDLKETNPTVFLVVPLLLEKLYLGLQKNIKKAPTTKRLLFGTLKGVSRIINPITRNNGSKILFKKVREQLGLGALRYLISGGSALPRWLSKGYEFLGFPIYQGYGLSETSPVVSANLPGKIDNESAGLPLPGVEVKIANPNPEGIGEIIVRGPNVMKGYYKNPEATSKIIKDGWFYTGDLGKIDKRGFIYITGRKKSVIVTSGGKNIYPEEIEEKLGKSPYIKEVLVMGRINPDTRAEEIYAIVHPDFEVLDQYAEETELTINDQTIQRIMEEEIEKVNEELAIYKRIGSFSIREEEFPKTTTQKIKRYLFEQGGVEIR